MDLNAVLTILLIIALLALNTFFSFVEMSFASMNRARIKNMSENGSKRAGLVLRLHERFDELISTLLICDNIVYVAAATVSAFLFLRLFGEVGPFISGIVISIVVVVFADDLPKSMAKQAPEKFALFSAPIMRVLMVLLKPINYLLVSCKTRINAFFFSSKDKTDGEERGFRGEELLYVVEEAEQDGTITEEDSLRISNAIEFNDLLIADILTPRVNIVGIPQNASIEDISNTFLESGYSRLPVYEDNIDNIVGVIHIRDFLKCTVSEAGAKSLNDIMAPVVYAALVTQVSELFKLLQKERKHMAVVADEYGGTEGLVTMDDILRQLVGDIWDETDEDIEAFLPLGNNKHKVLCTADIYKMYEYFDLELEDELDSLTVGGWITDVLERIPKKGDSFTYKNLVVTVTKASPKRAEECLIEVVPEPSGERARA